MLLYGKSKIVSHWSKAKLKPNIIWSLLGIDNMVLARMATVTIYCKIPSNIFLSGTNRQIAMKLVMKYCPLGPIIICSNDDPGWTLTYFTWRSNLVNYAIVREEWKLSIFHKLLQPLISKLVRELMKLHEYQVKVTPWPLTKFAQIIISKLVFRWNYWTSWDQISYENSSEQFIYMSLVSWPRWLPWHTYRY